MGFSTGSLTRAAGIALLVLGVALLASALLGRWTGLGRYPSCPPRTGERFSPALAARATTLDDLYLEAGARSSAPFETLVPERKMLILDEVVSERFTHGALSEYTFLGNWLFRAAGRYRKGNLHIEDPDTLLRLGHSALCDEVSFLLYRLAEKAGIPARHVFLDGHVVMEASYGGAWHAFDPDLEVVLKDDSGAIASVAWLRANPERVRAAYGARWGDDTGKRVAAIFSGEIQYLAYPRETGLGVKGQRPGRAERFAAWGQYAIPLALAILGAGLARISHHPPATSADPGMSTAFRSIGLLDVVSTTPASPSGRAPCIHARLRRLATKRGEKCGLAFSKHGRAPEPSAGSPLVKEGIRDHFEQIADDYDGWKRKASHYYSLLAEIYREFVPEGASVLEVGCGTGTLLASLRPRRGVGVDVSARMVEIARAKFPGLTFLAGDAERLALGERFDFIIVPDVIEHLADVPAMFRSVHGCCRPGSRVIVTCVNPLWAPVLHLAERFRMKMPEGEHRWLPAETLKTMAADAGFETASARGRILLPKHVPVLAALLNRLAKLRFLAPVDLLLVLEFVPRDTPPRFAKGRSR